MPHEESPGLYFEDGGFLNVQMSRHGIDIMRESIWDKNCATKIVYKIKSSCVDIEMFINSSAK